MGLVLTNNAETKLAAGISAAATEIEVLAAEGGLFPTYGSGDWTPLYLIKADGSGYEIVRATDRTGDTITIARQREGTTALTFDAGDIVSARLTAEALGEFTNSGVQDFVIQRGVNFGIATGTSNAVAVVVNNLASLTNNMVVNFKPIAANTSGLVTINVSQLGAKSVVYLDPEGVLQTVFRGGLIHPSIVASVRYDSANDRFVLQNPRILPAAVNQSGVAKRGAAETFDETNGDNEKFTTQLNVSKIISDFFSMQASETFPFKWRNFGRGLLNDLVINANTTFNAGLNREYDNFTIDAGATLTLNGGRTTVIRAQQSIVINGNIVVGDHTSDYGSLMVGPRGSSGVVTGSAPEFLGEQAPYVGPQGAGGPLSASSFDLAVFSDADFQLFHGGNSRGRVNNASNDIIVYGCAGLILIAPSITIGNTAEIDIQSRAGTPGDAGGGIIVLAHLDDLTVDPAADFIAGDGTTSQPAAAWNGAANETTAGNGTMFEINLGNASTAKIF